MTLFSPERYPGAPLWPPPYSPTSLSWQKVITLPKKCLTSLRAELEKSGYKPLTDLYKEKADEKDRLDSRNPIRVWRSWMWRERETQEEGKLKTTPQGRLQSDFFCRHAPIQSGRLCFL